MKSEIPKSIRHPDNLKLEGAFQNLCPRDGYKPVIGERAEMKKLRDNLVSQGELGGPRPRDDYQIVKGDKAEIVKYSDNLKLEGESIAQVYMTFPCIIFVHYWSDIIMYDSLFNTALSD
jgi:hypothetical protein